MTNQPKKLIPEQRAAIRERVEKATPEPWITKIGRRYQIMLSDDSWFSGNYLENGVNDVNFIARARTDVPALLGHIEAVEAELSQQKALVERLRAASIAIDTWSLVIESAVRRDVSPDTHNSVLAAIKANREALALIAEQAQKEGV